MPGSSGQNPMLHLQARDRTDEPREYSLTWNPAETALLICDMWDKHWCASATARVAEMAPVMNQVIGAARAQGIRIMHAPSDTLTFYAATPQRQKALAAPPIPVPEIPRRPDEPPLPIDDSDGGCDDSPQCQQYKAWTRQHPALEISQEDAISDNGPEVYRLLKHEGRQNILMMGVHTNMCVLDRSFGIRHLVGWGFHVALVRDLTDTMYNPQMPPHVSHFEGTDRVIAHIEQHWCPSILSSDFSGLPAFHFQKAGEPG